MPAEITVSIVSHGQAGLIKALLKDLDDLGMGDCLKEVIITVNIPEDHQFEMGSAPIKLIANDSAKGFGENHNAAFKQSETRYFCVLNPDIRLNQNPFPALLESIQAHQGGVVAPRVVDAEGNLEDSARPFPTIYSLFRKLCGNKSAGRYGADVLPDSPDWVAGMFMLFDCKAFSSVDGFDEKYFLYYEDVDICARLRKAGWHVRYCPKTSVTHDARRDSHRKLRYLKWHLSSMLRFFLKFRGGLALPLNEKMSSSHGSAR